MRLFNKFLMKIFSTISRSNTTLQGQQKINEMYILIEQKEYRKALDLADEIERKYPEFFKALFIYRGQASVGLAKQMGLLQEEPTNDPLWDFKNMKN